MSNISETSLKKIIPHFHWKCKHTWKRSAKNTAWCLLGCSIGDFGTYFPAKSRAEVRKISENTYVCT